MTVQIFTEGFDGVTAPNLPSAGWASFGTGYTTSTLFYWTATNSLKYSNAGAAASMALTTLSDGYSGNAQATAYVLFPTAPNTQTAWRILLRYLNATNYYYLNIEPVGSTNAGMSFWKVVAGTTTQIGSTTAATGITVSNSTWYIVTFQTNGSSLSWAVQRTSDWATLASNSTWGGGAGLVVNDSSLTGSGQSGLQAIQANAADPAIYADSFAFYTLQNPRMKHATPKRSPREPVPHYVW